MQEKFKSNLEFRYKIIVSSIIFFKKKGFAKLTIPIALFKKFLSKQLIVSVEVKFGTQLDAIAKRMS